MAKAQSHMEARADIQKKVDGARTNSNIFRLTGVLVMGAADFWAGEAIDQALTHPDNSGEIAAEAGFSVLVAGVSAFDFNVASGAGRRATALEAVLAQDQLANAAPDQPEQ